MQCYMHVLGQLCLLDFASFLFGLFHPLNSLKSCSVIRSYRYFSLLISLASQAQVALMVNKFKDIIASLSERV
ncbi:hypothetical protein F5Y16DRAFT_360449 [Xylariaceae sp. FL0255]|nr:hypothetical protein F5Y16DRAFT_360449 [Xylariaceae sp. FL0255]